MNSILPDQGAPKRLVENCLTLDLAPLMRLSRVPEGQEGSGELRWSVEGETIGEISFGLDFRMPENARLILNFYAPQINGELKAVKQTIHLAKTRQHLGGYRWWLFCPITGKRARTLHLPPNGRIFASREALRLCYRVERLDHFDRAFEKMFRVQRRLRQPEGLGTTIERPKGMWRRTFERHLERFLKAEIACMDEIGALIQAS